MYNNEPSAYECPLCMVAQGKETPYNKRNDVVYENGKVIAFISPKWWVNNPGNVLVVPKHHVENIYDIPDDLLAEVQIIGKRIALAIKETYGCDGVSFRQHNEPGGGQDVWHFHLHVFPRWKDDELYQNHNNKRYVEEKYRSPYAEILRNFLAREKS